MKTKIRQLYLLIGLLIVCAGSVQAHATLLVVGASQANNYVNDHGSSQARRAAVAARSHVGGRVISVKPEKRNSGYRVRMLVDGGRVVTVEVDAKGRVRADR
jgi:ribosomal protein L34